LKRRGRPLSFDRESVLKSAMMVFWRHGYDGTSIAMLLDAMQISAPSLYATFGSKQALFLESLELYEASGSSEAAHAFENARDDARRDRGDPARSRRELREW
jgi:AcrR family transcriptional regulator